MGQMILFELEKIWSRRVVVLGLLLVIGMAFLASVTGMHQEVATADGRVLTGEEARAYIQEHTDKYAGLLNDEKKEAILKKEGPSEEIEYGEYRALPLYSSMKWLFKDGYAAVQGKTVKELFTERGITVNVGNADPWVDMLDISQTWIIFLGTVLVMGLSGVFSEEYGRRTDALILTARHGKRRCVQAKVIASFVFSIGSYVCLVLAAAVPFLLKNGCSGADAGVQLDTYLGLYEVPYTLSCGEAALLQILGGFLEMVMLTGVTLAVSVLCKTPFLAVVAAEAVYFLPALAAQSIKIEYMSLTPIGAGIYAVMTLPKIHIGGMELVYYVAIAVTAAVLTTVVWFAVRRVFAAHEVR